MPPAKDRDRKGDVLAWCFNISTSIGIIMVNKQLLSVYGFNFATTLTGCHFLVTATMTAMLSLCGYISPSHVPLWELIKFALAANVSIVGMNVSLMWNNVGFYQIAKLSMIPVSCFLEIVFDKVRYSRATKVSILVVLAGVAVCTVTDVSVNLRGLTAAAIAVWTSALQQYYVHSLQRKHRLGSFELLGHTAPLQAASLLLLGPAVDYWLSGRRIDAYEYSVPSVVCIGVSCAIAVGTNLSQFVCIGRFTAVTFQVVGGMALAIVGMVWYGNAVSKPGGKERMQQPLLTALSDEKAALLPTSPSSSSEAVNADPSLSTEKSSTV